MVLSFMGNRRRRILQCYFDGMDLVIYKSPLFDFSLMKKAQLPIQIFVQCLASSPVSDTKSICWRKLVCTSSYPANTVLKYSAYSNT
jgi:hypothetical protein